MTRMLRASLPTALLALLAPSPTAAVDPASAVDAVVSAHVVRAERCAVDAAIYNRGAREIRDVRLLVECVYHWPDEHHPGDESPGRAWKHVVPGPIAPGEGAIVHSAPPGGPPTAPGAYEPRVRVLGFSERSP